MDADWKATDWLGRCIIVNGIDKPCDRLIAQVDAVKSYLQGMTIVTQLSYHYCNLPANPPGVELTTDARDATLVEDFGRIVLGAEGDKKGVFTIPVSSDEEIKSTYFDGRPRYWQD